MAPHSRGASPTRADVAREAGVSTAVVSYVINAGPRPVSASARDRVQRAVELLGYRPNGSARALRYGRTHTLGVVVPDTGNPYYAELTTAIEDEAFGRGYAVLLGNSAHDRRREEEQVQALVSRQVDGLLVVSVDPAEIPAALIASGAPSVLVHRNAVAAGISSVVINNRAAACDATRHLIQTHGLRDVACLAGPEGFLPALDRLAGWRDALRAARVPVRRARWTHSPISRRGGYEAALRLLDVDDPPSGLFVNSDLQAVGTLRACAELGLAVPANIAVVAFDGTEESEFTLPPLTVIQHPVRELAATAVAMVLDTLTDQVTTDAEVRVLGHSLVLRQSCGCS